MGPKQGLSLHLVDMSLKSHLICVSPSVSFYPCNLFVDEVGHFYCRTSQSGFVDSIHVLLFNSFSAPLLKNLS